jgi:hypothetical protein
MHKVFLSVINSDTHVVSCNSDEIIDFEFSEDFVELYEGSKRQCNEFVDYMNDEETISKL